MASSGVAWRVPGLTALGLDGTGFGPDLPGFGPAADETGFGPDWTGGGPVPWKPNGVSRGTGVVHRVACLAFPAVTTGKRNRAKQSPMASSDMAWRVPGLTALGLDGTGVGPADEVADPFRGSPTA